MRYVKMQPSRYRSRIQNDIQRIQPGGGTEIFSSLDMAYQDLSVVQAHDIAELAHHRLLHEVPRLSDALVHTDPCDHDGADHHRQTAHHAGRDARAGVSSERPQTGESPGSPGGTRPGRTGPAARPGGPG